MNRANLKAQLIIDEGRRLVTYYDSLGNLTVGIGHLVTPTDNLAYGDRINLTILNNFFNTDLDTAIEACNSIWPQFSTLPDTVQEVLANMAFNLGQYRLEKFIRLIAAINTEDYKAASLSMQRSLWYTQVGNRAKRLVARMETCL